MATPKALLELIRRTAPGQTAQAEHHQRTLAEPAQPAPADIIQQITKQLPPSSHQHFTSLLTRLSPPPPPREKPAILRFLLALTNHRQPPPPTLDALPQPDPARPSAAHKLRLYRAQHGFPAHLPEHLLLRDMVYLLQGIDGRHIHFKASNPHDESWEEGGIGFLEPADRQLIIPLPQRDLLLKLSELGWLYTKIRAATDHPPPPESTSTPGTVQQAFAFALTEELALYYRAIAIIQSHLTAQPTTTTLSAKALLLHLAPTVLRLRMAAALISATKHTRGGQMISVLHSYTHHGDPLVHLFTSNLLDKVSVPWFNTLVSWICHGELLDPAQEFFIARNTAYAPDHHCPADGWNVWQNKFSFRKEMVPSFISEGFARKIFSTGKSLNFIRHSCGDYEWHQTRLNISQASSKASLHYKDIAGLQQTIESTYAIATRRLFNIFFIKLKLLDHFKAVKDYLLLGRGDFISLLIDSLGPSLNRPANTLYRHNLTATLESAIRATSDERLLLNRLDVRMLELSPLESGWEVFMLEYKTERPLDVVLSAAAMEKYMRMFRVLWKMKRLEYSLDRAWKLVILGVNRALKHLHFLRDDFHRARLVISEMIHFIRQLQSYCHLEVIDCGWQEFEKKLMSEGGDLDSLIEGHSAYLDRLVSKGLLLSTRAGKENTCLLLAEECFKVILEYKDSIDNLYAYGLARSARLETSQPRAARSKYASREDSDDDAGAAGDGSLDGHEDASAGDASSAIQLESIRITLANHSRRFTELVLDLISALSTQQDSDMKFLAVRLNFSLFYMRTTKASSNPATAAGGPPPPAQPPPSRSTASTNAHLRSSSHLHRPLSSQSRRSAH